MLVESIFIHYDVPIPPAAGPERARFVRREGLHRLRASLRAYGIALRLIGIDLLGGIHRLPIARSLMTESQLSEEDSAREVQLAWRNVSDLIRVRIGDSVPKSSNYPQLHETFASAEKHARQALTMAVEAYNLLEDDTDLEDYAHQNAHNVAAFVGGAFGCTFEYKNGIYYDSCPLSMMHHRWGSSMGFTCRRKCSICGEDIDDLDRCPHLLDRKYPVQVHIVDGKCSACGGLACGHSEGETIRLFPTAVPIDLDIHEISWVSNPRDPLARPSAVSVDIDLLVACLGRIPEGASISCYRCLAPCNGFHHPDFSGKNGPPELANPYSQGFVSRVDLETVRGFVSNTRSQVRA